MSWNIIGDEGASKIGEALMVNTTLTKLVMPFNSIEDKGVMQIEKSLKVNTTLTELKLW